MSDPNLIHEIPMRVVGFKKESKGRTWSRVFTREIRPDILTAKTFGEVYIALVKMKMNLLALGVFDDVELTMDTPDFITSCDTDVMVRMNIKESRPLRIGIQGSVTTSGNDAGIEGSIDYLNSTGFADILGVRVRYDLMRQNVFYNISHKIPKIFYGYSSNLDYVKESRNLLKESSVYSLLEGVTISLTSPSNRLSFGYSFTWRDLTPATDIDVERITNHNCSKSMMNECRPSLKSTLFTTMIYDTRNHPVVPTSGIFARLKIGYSGLLGDVHHLKLESNLNTSIPISPTIFGEPGIALHLSSYTGYIRNLNRRNTRYFDRFFLNGENIRGFDMADIGPRSQPEDGGRKEGDVLGGERCASVGASVSFPVVLGLSQSIGIRGQVFWNMGNIWNRNTNLHKVLHSALSSYGVGVMIPFGGVGRLELNYSISQKRFNFLFCAM